MANIKNFWDRISSNKKADDKNLALKINIDVFDDLKVETRIAKDINIDDDVAVHTFIEFMKDYLIPRVVKTLIDSWIEQEKIDMLLWYYIQDLNQIKTNLKDFM